MINSPTQLDYGREPLPEVRAQEPELARCSSPIIRSSPLESLKPMSHWQRSPANSLRIHMPECEAPNLIFGFPRQPPIRLSAHCMEETPTQPRHFTTVTSPPEIGEELR